MNRDKLEPHRYEYLTRELSDLYDRLSRDPSQFTHAQLVVMLRSMIEDESNKSKARHGAAIG